MPWWRNWYTCLPAGRRAWLRTMFHKDWRFDFFPRQIYFMYYVYALKSIRFNYIYVGIAVNIEKRVKQHNDGKEKTTRFYRPFKLIYTENHKTRIEARAREKYLKSGFGKEFLKSLL